MAASLATRASASPATKSSVAVAAGLHHRRHDSLSKLSFPLSSKSKLKLRLFTKGFPSSRSRSTSTSLRAGVNEAAVDGSSNAAATPTKSELSPLEGGDSKPSNEPSSDALASQETISEFITQVSSLVKLVDSRDIVELQMKQLDCELIIRKREALPQPPPPVPVAMVHAPQPAVPPSAAPGPSTSMSSAPKAIPPPPAGKPAKSSLPPLKCPMAGTFYRSPGPGEAPFVKVGDKIQKGQVVCIIEAMKLMNEIEADQSGTIVEILAEDGKPVSVDSPLLVIQP